MCKWSRSFIRVINNKGDFPVIAVIYARYAGGRADPSHRLQEVKEETLNRHIAPNQNNLSTIAWCHVIWRGRPAQEQRRPTYHVIGVSGVALESLQRPHFTFRFPHSLIAAAMSNLHYSLWKIQKQRSLASTTPWLQMRGTGPPNV